MINGSLFLLKQYALGQVKVCKKIKRPAQVYKGIGPQGTRCPSSRIAKRKNQRTYPSALCGSVSHAEADCKDMTSYYSGVIPPYVCRCIKM